jgi:type I restriction enzyme S subunit
LNSTTSGLRNLNKDLYLSQTLRVPPLAEQRRIAGMLDKADGVRRKRRESLGLLDEFLRSAFLEMFGDPVRNEKGWEKIRASSVIARIEPGSSVKGEEGVPGPGEWAVLKISAVTSGRFLPDECKVVLRAPESKIVPAKGDLLFSRANTRELVAATCLVDREASQVFLPDKLWRITTEAKVAVVEYLRYLLAHTHFRSTLTKDATGTSGSMLNVSQEKLLRLPLPIPPVQLQERFARLVWKVYGTRRRLQEAGAETESLFDSLAQRAFGRG